MNIKLGRGEFRISSKGKTVKVYQLRYLYPVGHVFKKDDAVIQDVNPILEIGSENVEGLDVLIEALMNLRSKL